METDKEKILDQESVFTISDEKDLISIIRRDPISKKHLVYLVKEATSVDIASLIKPGMMIKQLPEEGGKK